MKFVKGLVLASLLVGSGIAIPQVQPIFAQDRAPIQLNENQLGDLLKAMGLEPSKKMQRYDFAFEATLAEEAWELSMSAVLSQDGTDIWIMAWLDEMPKSSTEVPKTALLRLLAQNDQLGNGKFFAYVPNSRRFVLQRTISNEDLTSARLKMILEDLGASVVETYPIWAVANWNPTGIPAAPTNSSPPTGPATQSAAQPATPQFQQPIVK